MNNKDVKYVLIYNSYSCGDVFSYNGEAGELTSVQVSDTRRAEFH